MITQPHKINILHKNWEHTKSDFKSPLVGDFWVSINPYSNEIFENTVISVAENNFTLQNTYGASFCISTETLKAEGIGLSEFDFYPLTEDVQNKIELRKEITKVYYSLRNKLDKLNILDLTHEQRKAFLSLVEGLNMS
jgi:hypothetical protein